MKLYQQTLLQISIFVLELCMFKLTVPESRTFSVTLQLTQSRSCKI